MNGWAMGEKLGNGVALGDGVIYIGLGSLVRWFFLFFLVDGVRSTRSYDCRYSVVGEGLLRNRGIIAYLLRICVSFS